MNEKINMSLYSLYKNKNDRISTLYKKKNTDARSLPSEEK